MEGREDSKKKGRIEVRTARKKEGRKEGGREDSKKEGRK